MPTMNIPSFIVPSWCFLDFHAFCGKISVFSSKASRFLQAPLVDKYTRQPIASTLYSSRSLPHSTQARKTHKISRLVPRIQVSFRNRYIYVSKRSDPLSPKNSLSLLIFGKPMTKSCVSHCLTIIFNHLFHNVLSSYKYYHTLRSRYRCVKKISC